jgi:hypothetical protein
LWPEFKVGDPNLEIVRASARTLVQPQLVRGGGLQLLANVLREKRLQPMGIDP